ncbi:serine hydrolase [Actinomyces naeslundii]|uniref:Serine hydrolase n=3 Tax=Actinomyces naeslundii TaxID=1655 RepID=A0A854EAN0_ACTNA|nr:serine hydrolase [Actinomyces naeslundii]OMG20238.1 serine hydrolase [Actinomyces naeslundii]OMG35052.1 serine hydrolase [Actinomyces naeslundii]OMG41926.1 serine hydrolase [Actinomyces naeslundii]QQC20919.1 beta-lactamase family protein [Actinomyces naeslundii]
MNMNATRNVTRRGVALVVVALLASLSLLTACGSTSSSASLPPREPPSGEHQLTAEDVNAWLDGKLPDALKNGGIPGAVVSVVKDGQVVTTRGYGWADTGASGGNPVAVDPQKSLFRVASVSKIPTSIAAMQLVEQGKVDLDADISAYLDFEIERRFDEPLTLRHLLTHSAGFEEHGSLTPTTDLEAYVKNDPPAQVFAPGTTPGYANYGMALAGYIVQRVSGQPFETYVREHVLEPAGMTSSTYEQPLPKEMADLLGPGYTSTGEEVPFELMGDFPAGSLTVSAPDFAAFMNAQLSRSPKLLRAETWEQMWSPGLGEDKLGNRAKAGEMGLGYFDLSRNGQRVVGHGGDNQGWHSQFELYPEEKTGIFISYNGDGNGSDSSSSLREDLAQGFADRYFPGETVKASGSKDSADRARQVAGSYMPSRTSWTTFLSAWMPALALTTIEHTGDGKLKVDETQLVEVEPWVWRQVDGRGAIAAQVKDGKVVSLSQGPALTLIPVTPVQQVLVPVFGVCLVLLLVATVAWPVGALRRRRALKRGQEVGAPVPWLTRVARGGGVLALSAQLTWTLLLVVFVANSSTITDGSFTWLIPVARCAQVLQALGVVAVIPAAADLVIALRRRAGWRRVTMSAILLTALVALAWWAWAGNALAPSLGM